MMVQRGYELDNVLLDVPKWLTLQHPIGHTINLFFPRLLLFFTMKLCAVRIRPIMPFMVLSYRPRWQKERLYRYLWKRNIPVNMVECVGAVGSDAVEKKMAALLKYGLRRYYDVKVYADQLATAAASRAAIVEIETL